MHAGFFTMCELFPYNKSKCGRVYYKSKVVVTREMNNSMRNNNSENIRYTYIYV